MNPIVYHVASGHSFFTGVALIVVAAITSRQSGRIACSITLIGFSLGIVAVAVSSTPLPLWAWGGAFCGSIAWLSAFFVMSWRHWASFALIAAWSVAAVVEMPFHWIPSPVAATEKTFAVIGDSVTAGMGSGDKSERWPRILSRLHRLEVQDNSQMGETVNSALKRLDTHPVTASFVLLEIGGNDLMGSTTPAEFQSGLDALLAKVCVPGRQIMMFELPLPPFRSAFGRIQRSLAAHHGVLLIPKRVLLSIIAGGSATIDSVHLTQTGHENMEQVVWDIVGTAFVGE